MERIATGPEAAASRPSPGITLSGTTAALPPPGVDGTAAVRPPGVDGIAALAAPGVAGLLDGMPRQRGATAPAPVFVEAPPAAPAPRWWHLLPTPAGTPFTFAYVAVLAVTSVVTALADPALVHSLHAGSSTDVAHLLRAPVAVLLASAVWIAGGLLSPYALAVAVVLTALERRTGGVRAMGVFLAGHVVATLATEVPVGLAVLFGHLPQTSLHRLDYGISFGVAAGIGALAGLLRPWLRWPLLLLVGGTLVNDLIAFSDPMTNWGHLIALATGVASWPLVRPRRRAAGPAPRSR
ncbi:rhomboid-like protein [Streptomyces sp. NPDC048514]|uniref:rhomboid-like protein n=1 Tax=Streptomyces sp. NPDC048514 TaxID=3365564 RepID=UPI0037190FC4